MTASTVSAGRTDAEFRKPHKYQRPKMGSRAATEAPLAPSGEQSEREDYRVTVETMFHSPFAPTPNNALILHTSYRNDLVLTRRELTSGKVVLATPQLTATRSNSIQPVSSVVT